MVSATVWWETLFSVLAILENIDINYTLVESSALFAQGVVLQEKPIHAQTAPNGLELSIQWDLMQRVAEAFGVREKPERQAGCESFHVPYQGLTVTFYSYLNTVVVTDPDRLQLQHMNRTVWVKALDYYLHAYPEDHPVTLAVQRYFQQLQQHNSALNQSAWNQAAYDAWVQRHGPPQVQAARIQKDPQTRLASLNKYLPPIAGKKVINLLGSHGTKAIALAILGAQVTIVDMSQENAHYAREVAAAARVQLRYLVTDVLKLSPQELDGSYDLVFMELGILHYFVDLAPLARIVQQLLRSGGRLILQDFHPVSTKLLSSKGKKHKVSGNYFDKSLHATDVAFSKHLTEKDATDIQQVYQRYWNLGEIITAFAATGLVIQRLDEEPNSKIDDMGIPKTFTLVAER
ncbi:class I SAM-dependent methyltransferase [Dictyobacter formicarum]|uniref:class I SAM-dependent methyltransferase n=1 Tax=Dictyobacter formicarum TaxID=2778368 RepID=UPI0019163D7C|nr:class I SAM-dependent methyltransferase [Dictyobacter formicarum]